MIVHGLHPVIEAIRAGRAERVRVATSGAGGGSGNAGRPSAARPAGLSSRLAQVVELARERGVPVEFADPLALERLVRGGAHQGVVAQVRVDSSSAWTPESLVEAAAGTPLLVVLDGIEDPQNVGAVLRSAEAAGVDGVIRQTRRAAPLAAAVARASAGAVHHVRIASVVNIARALEALRQRGIWVVGLASEAAECYDEVDYTVPTALVLGAEGRGLRRLVRETCDRLVHIPMRGRVESLNVSVAAGIVLYEAVRQRRRLDRGDTCRPGRPTT